MTAYDDYILSWVATSDQLVVGWVSSDAFDSAAADDSIVLAQTVNVPVSDTTHVSDSIVAVRFPGTSITATARASDSAAVSTKYDITLAGSATAGDKASLGWSAALSASAHASDSMVYAQWVSITGRVKVGEMLAAVTRYGMSVTGQVRASDSVTVQDAKFVADSAHASDSVTLAYEAGAGVADGAQASDFATIHRIVAPNFMDGVSASDSAEIVVSYMVSLVETVCVHEDYYLPSADTAWAINTRTQAVTEYRGYAFNSFAQMGRKYLGADEDGLYELNGPSDDGVDVRAVIAGGFTQMNGNKFSGLKAVYLNASGQGLGATPSWLLTLDAGDGREWVYQTTSNPNMMTTKFNIGKGIRTTYLGWQIENADGQDFNLNNIELIPAMMGRRV